jgi:hypothetical protein
VESQSLENDAWYATGRPLTSLTGKGINSVTLYLPAAMVTGIPFIGVPSEVCAQLSTKVGLIYCPQPEKSGGEALLEMI